MKYLLFTLTLVLTFAPLTTQAAFGLGDPIIPAECKCESAEVVGSSGETSSSAPAWGCVLQTIQNVIRVAIALGIAFATLALMYAGFVWMTSGGSAERRNQGSHLLINVFIGLAVMLGAWLIVDFIMKELYNEETQFGPWNSILSGDGNSGDRCLVVRTPSPIAEGTLDIVTGGGGTYTGGGSGSNCPAADPAGMVAFPSSATDGESEKATPNTVRNFLAMREEALKVGIDLRVTDGYRPESEQLVLWDRYNQDTSQVAKPCSLGGNGSNHNSGVALDIAVGCAKTNSNCSSPAYKWLKANGGRWGFTNNLPNDVVHWSPTGR